MELNTEQIDIITTKLDKFRFETVEGATSDEKLNKLLKAL